MLNVVICSGVLLPRQAESVSLQLYFASSAMQHVAI